MSAGVSVSGTASWINKYIFHAVQVGYIDNLDQQLIVAQIMPLLS